MPDSEDLSLEDELDIQAQSAKQEYETRSDLNALEEWVQTRRLITDMTEDDSPEKADTLMNLGVSLHACTIRGYWGTPGLEGIHLLGAAC